jgi:hypothetical protein
MQGRQDEKLKKHDFSGVFERFTRFDPYFPGKSESFALKDLKTLAFLAENNYPDSPSIRLSDSVRLV